MRRNARGIALLVTVAILAVAVALSLEMNRRGRSAATWAAMSRNRTTLSAMAASGVQAAMAILIRDKSETEIDSIQEVWADPEMVQAVVSEMPFDAGRISVTIADEQAKIQVNALVQGQGGRSYTESQRMLWDRFLRIMHARIDPGDPVNPEDIICALKDWMDSEDDDAASCMNGAESDYYESLTPPYPCRNGPVPHIGDLLRVRGMTQDLFYGIPPEKGIADSVSAYRGEDAQWMPIGAFGRININTADLPVLAAVLPSGKEDLAPALADYRSEMSEGKYTHDLSNPLWYKEVAGLHAAVIDPQLITLSSDLFRIRAAARMDQQSVTATVLIHREMDPVTGRYFCRVLTWFEE